MSENGAGPLELLGTAPALARIAADAAWRGTTWTVGAYGRLSRRVLRAALQRERPADLFADLGDDLRVALVAFLGAVDDLAGQAQAGAQAAEESVAEDLPPEHPKSPRPARNGNGAAHEEEDDPTRALRERGAELLRRSSDVTYEEVFHPAYERILGSMAPDEARIVRFLCEHGPQPSVDVRGGKRLSPTTEMVAPGINMIGQEAGCRYTERLPMYLNNLYRLGLLWFSREALEDPLDYQVLEAQPSVQEAMAESGRSKTIRRSIHLTPFGKDFCAVCLPHEVEEAAGVEAS